MSRSNYRMFIVSEKAAWLRQHYPWAFLLLNLIAERARREPGYFDGLEPGQALIGDYQAIGATRGQYRHALKILEELKLITINLKNRNGHFATIKTTIKGTLVTLLDSSIWDINIKNDSHQNSHPATIKQPSNNHEQERTRKNKNEKETTTPKPPLFADVSDAAVVFFKDLKDERLCESDIQALKPFTVERIKLALAFANHPKTKIKRDLISTLIWHCQQEIPPAVPGPAFTPQQMLAFNYIQQLKSINWPWYEEQNKNSIENHYLILWLGGVMKISLKNPYEIIKKDLDDSLVEIENIRKKTQ